MIFPMNAATSSFSSKELAKSYIFSASGLNPLFTDGKKFIVAHGPKAARLCREAGLKPLSILGK